MLGLDAFDRISSLGTAVTPRDVETFTATLDTVGEGTFTEDERVSRY